MVVFFFGFFFLRFFLKNMDVGGPCLRSLLKVTILLLFYVLVFWLQGMWDLSSILHPLQWKVKLTTGPPRKSPFECLHHH